MERGAGGREREGRKREEEREEEEEGEEEEARRRSRGRGKEQEEQQLGLTEAAGGSSVPCTELEIWEVEWTAAVGTGPCTQVFPAHSLKQSPVCREPSQC